MLRIQNTTRCAAGVDIRFDLEPRCGFGEMQAMIEDVIARTPAVIGQVRKLIPPAFSVNIANSILQGISARAEQISEGHA